MAATVDLFSTMLLISAAVIIFFIGISGECYIEYDTDCRTGTAKAAFALVILNM